MRYTINDNVAPVLVDPDGSDCQVEWTVTGLQSYSVTGGSFSEIVGEATVVHAFLTNGGEVSVTNETEIMTYRFDGSTLVGVTT